MTARVCLLTRHRKVAAIAPALRSAGFVVDVVSDFDTDRLGTFSGEIERQGTMREAALAKARIACELGSSRHGLGSEGSFGGDPFLGVSPWGRELVLWWDAELGYAVEGFVQGPETNWRSGEVTDIEGALRFAQEIGFPDHGVIVGRPGEAWFDKSCETPDALQARVAEALPGGPVLLQADMRAHRNPTRMRMIASAAAALAGRLARPCPACAAPGYGPVDGVPGALCEACGTPTRVARAERWACPRCAFEEQRPLQQQAPAAQCDRCNP